MKYKHKRKKKESGRLKFTELFGDFLIPKKLKKDFKDQLYILGIDNIPYSAITYIFFFSLFIDLIIAIYLPSKIMPEFPIETKIFAGFVIFIICIFLVWKFFYAFYRTIYNTVYTRKIRLINKALPMFLLELNLHLRSGMILSKSLEDSIKPEFGVLNDLIKEVNRDIKLGTDTYTAFTKVSSRYKSESLKEVFNLIGKSDIDGGRTISLVENLTTNLNTSAYLKNETEASVGSYLLFIALIAVFISPALFAASYYVLILLKQVMLKFISSGFLEIANINIKGISLDEAKYRNFAMIASMISAYCSAYIIGLMKESKRDIKHYIMTTLWSLGAFLLAYWILGFVFGNIQL